MAELVLPHFCAMSDALRSARVTYTTAPRNAKRERGLSVQRSAFSAQRSAPTERATDVISSSAFTVVFVISFRFRPYRISFAFNCDRSRVAHRASPRVV